MPKMLTPAEWRATLPEAEQFIAAAVATMHGRPPVEGKISIRMDELPHGSPSAREIFTRQAEAYGWDVEFKREGGGPELLLLTPRE